MTAYIDAPLADAAIHPLLAERWSPRAFTPDAVSEAALTAMLQAARWAPSAANTQPWRFSVVRNGEPAFADVVAGLAPGNQVWAQHAPVLLVAIAQVERDGRDVSLYGAYDLGQAVAHLSVQAHAEGLHVHQMGGFDHDAVAAALAVPAGFRPLTVVAIGRVGDPATLPDGYRERETAPRTRLDLSEIVVRGSF